MVRGQRLGDDRADIVSHHPGAAAMPQVRLDTLHADTS
jgi:hypothetical protein